MLPRLDRLILDARSASTNDDHGDEYGLSDELFVAAANDCLIELQKYLIIENGEPFAEFEEISATANTESYSAPSRIFSPNMIYGIEYSSDGRAVNYYDLDLSLYRGNAEAGNPQEYFVDGGLFYVDYMPTTAGGTYRVRYEKSLDRVDLRRGTIESRTISAGAITDIVLTSGTEDSDILSGAEYVCVCDRYGNITMRNIPIDSWDSSTRTLTMPSGGHTYDTGETAPVGSYITAKADCSTHPLRLPDCAENFIVDFMKMKAYESQSSIDLEASDSPFAATLKSIVDVYSMRPSGKIKIPERRGDYY